MQRIKVLYLIKTLTLHFSSKSTSLGGGLHKGSILDQVMRPVPTQGTNNASKGVGNPTGDC